VSIEKLVLIAHFFLFNRFNVQSANIIVRVCTFCRHDYGWKKKNELSQYFDNSKN